MATITKIEKTGSRSWRFTWTGTAPFDVVLGGRVVLENTSETTYEAESATAYEPPPIEVIAAGAGSAQSQLYPPYLVVQWFHLAFAAYYRVFEYVDSAWIQRGRTITDSGDGYYTYTTADLTDCAESKWRVIPYDAYGGAGDPVDITVMIVRVPDPPSVELTYDEATNEILVSQR